MYIICSSKTPPIWMKEDGTIRHYTIINKNTLVLNNIRERDSGIYICNGTMEGEEEFIASSEVLVGGKLFS